MGVEMTKYSTADFVERLRDEQIDIARRHAELAALVKDLTVAVEALGRRVVFDARLALEMVERIGIGGD